MDLKFNESAGLSIDENPKEDLGFKFAHIGLKTESPESAMRIALFFHKKFGLPIKEGRSSVFVEDKIEAMESPFRGQYGHIAISTNDLSKAAKYLEGKGVSIDWASLKNDVNGNPVSIYLMDEISGYALHLMQKKER